MTRSYSVLVVDDDETHLSLVTHLLQAHPFDRVSIAGNGLEALQHIDRADRHPDLVICDVFMPDKDGIEVIQELARQQFTGGLILISAARTWAEFAVMLAKEQEVNLLEYVSKPFSAADFDAAITQFLNTVS